MNLPHIFRRYVFFLVGLVIMSFGVAFTIKANLGTSPISSFPYVVSLIAPVSVGTATFILMIVFISLQIIILRKNYQLIQLMQLPVAVLFGAILDFAVWTLTPIAPTSYLSSWMICLIGIVLTGIGISFEVAAGVVVVAGEGLILAICKAFNKSFPKVKIAFDCTMVSLAVILSVVSMHTLMGVREGTIAAAILVGVVATQVTKYFTKPFSDRFLN